MKKLRRSLPTYVQVERSRHGKVSLYFRKGHGKRIPLPFSYPSQEFTLAYQRCLAETQNTPRLFSSTKKAESLRWLVEQWRQSSDWLNTSTATKRQRENILRHVLERSGDVNFHEIVDQNIWDGREERKKTPSAANNFLKTMRALFRWAKERKLVVTDPAKEVKFLKVTTRGFPPWTIEDVQAYRAKWPLGTKQRLALEIYINTGFRRGDAALIGPQHVREGLIHIKAGKNKVDLYIPILPALADAISAGPVGEMSYLSSQYGRPFAKASLGNEFRKWCDAAGVKKSAHGLRKLAATMVADNGGSEQELQALFGWTTNTMSAIYTREANRKRQALQAAFKLMDEMERNEAMNRGHLPAPLPKLPAPSKKE